MCMSVLRVQQVATRETDRAQNDRGIAAWIAGVTGEHLERERMYGGDMFL